MAVFFNPFLPASLRISLPGVASPCRGISPGWFYLDGRLWAGVIRRLPRGTQLAWAGSMAFSLMRGHGAGLTHSWLVAISGRGVHGMAGLTSADGVGW